MSEPAVSPRRFLPQPVESITKSRRSLFAAEPIEAAAKSSRGKPGSQMNGTVREGVKDNQVSDSVDRNGKEMPVKIVPELVQVTIRANQAEPAITDTKQESSNKSHGVALPAISKPVDTAARKKFSPQLIETTRRSHRAGDTRRPADYLEDDDDDDDGPPLLPHERTQLPPPRPTRPETRMESGDAVKRRRPIPIPPANTRVSSSIDIPHHTSPWRTTSSHPHDNTRRHSFIVPTLEPIMSQPNSDDSNCPSLSTSPSLSSETSSVADLWQHASRMRESCDDRFSGYLLALAARAAEKQLQEQAMAAYVNDDFHEPPEHYANDRESDDSDSDVLELDLTTRGGNSTVRRESIDDVSWDVKEMRKYHAQLNRQNERHKAHDVDRPRKMSIKDEWAAVARQVGGATDASGAPKDIIGGWQKGIGLRPMRDAASPPMLGGDIQFRLCYSPQPTSSEFDEPQGANLVSQRHHSGGLWMGLCSTKTGKNEEKISEARPFASIDEVLANGTLPDTGPAPSVPSADNADKGVDIEAEIDQEYTDEFVTQVYNYLSLGYPCLARNFDEELSQVSGVPLEEICSADSLADAKGYVGLGEGVGVAMSGVTNGKCGRWKALRAYIREWAKQSPGMERGGIGPDTWGVRARKGSWAI